MDINVNDPLGEGKEKVAAQDHDVFVIAPEVESSLPTSDEAMGFGSGLHTDPVSSFGLGFVPGTQSLQGNDTSMVSKISKVGFDKCPVSQTDSSSEHGLGKAVTENHKEKLVSENPCNFEVDPQPQQNQEISVSGENLGTLTAKTDLANGDGNSSKQCGGNGKTSESVCEAANEAAKSENANGTEKSGEQCDGNCENSEKIFEAGNEAQSTNPAEFLPSEAPPRPRENVTIFDALETITRNSDDREDSFPNMNLVEVAKSRGVTFPPPRWWPKNGFK